MTIEELRARRQELLKRKNYELDLQAKGEGDNLALFMVEEELLDVNSQLRALTPRHRVSRGGTTNKEWASDHQQFIDWRRENNSLDDEIEDGRNMMKQAIINSREILTPHQWEIFSLWQSGKTLTAIADECGLAISTVSRTLHRAKERIQDEVTFLGLDSRLAAQKGNILKKQEREVLRLWRSGLNKGQISYKLGIDRATVYRIQERLKSQIYRSNRNVLRLDVSDPNVAKVLLAGITDKQAVCLYLYFGEWLTLREMGDLLGLNHSTIFRTMQRAMIRIGNMTGYQEVLLDNMDSIGDLAYQLYRSGADIDAEIASPPTEVRKDWGRASLGKEAIKNHEPHTSDCPPIAIRLSSGEITELGRRGRTDPHTVCRKRGALLAALLARRQSLLESSSSMGAEHPIYRWLIALFSKLTNLTRRPGRKRGSHGSKQ